MNGPSWTDVLTAWGTLGAVIVALGLALAPPVKRAFSAPRLSVATGVIEPFVRPVSSREIGVREWRLRVGIINRGRSTAIGVSAQLLHWWEYDPTRLHGKDWIELDTDPLALKWVSIRPGDERRGAPLVDVHRGSMELLDLVLMRSAGDVELLVDDDRQALFRRKASERIGTWRIEFALVGVEMRPSLHTIEFTLDGKSFVKAVRVSEPVPASNCTHVGLFHLLRQRWPDEADDSPETATAPAFDPFTDLSWPDQAGFNDPD